MQDTNTNPSINSNAYPPTGAALANTDMRRASEFEEDELFVAWSEDRQSATPQPLRAWIERYPAHRRALVDWAIDEPVLDAGLESMQADTRGEARTLAIGKNVLAEMRARYFAPQAVAAPAPAIADLVQAAKAHGMTAKALAGKVGIGLALMAKLNQRLIQVATLPDILVARLAAELKTGVAEVRAYLARPATLATSAQYKSDGVPQVAETEAFAEAIRTCTDMTAEEKQFWLSQN